MSEANGVSLRRRRSRVEAERLVLEFERSCLSRQAFCAQHGLSVATLDNYRKHRRPSEHGGPHSQGTSRILPVELVNSKISTADWAAAPSNGLWVELANGRRIQVAHGFDAATLERLLFVLEKA